MSNAQHINADTKESKTYWVRCRSACWHPGTSFLTDWCTKMRNISRSRRRCIGTRWRWWVKVEEDGRGRRAWGCYWPPWYKRSFGRWEKGTCNRRKGLILGKVWSRRTSFNECLMWSNDSFTHFSAGWSVQSSLSGDFGCSTPYTHSRQYFRSQRSLHIFACLLTASHS